MSASYFSNPRDFHVDGPFITANNYTHNAAPSRNVTAFDHLRENSAAEAVHSSDERCDAPKVHPETRKAVQEEILGWITHGDNDAEPKKILWVSGPAGAGKAAIAGSIAEFCEEKGLLAGSFFFSSFSGSEKRRSKRWVVATLVYSLLRHDGLQALRGHILSIIERDPAIFRTSLRNQCTALLLRPFHDALGQLDVSVLPKVIIFDGLDEVEAAGSRQRGKHEARMANEADQLEILAVLLQAAHDVHFPFRIIVVSRPERVISDFFATKANHVSRMLFLDEKYDPDSDITLFLNASFADIRRRYGMSAAWSGECDIRRLVDTASGQFIYAATVVRFLQSGEHPNPQALLRIVFDTVSQDTSLHALAPLDALYTRILMSSPDSHLAVRWIGAIDLFLSETPAQFTRQLLQDFEGQAEYLFENLTSLVRIPPVGDDESPYQFYHKSLVDYLRSAQRCGRALQYCFNTGPAFVWERWFGVLKTKSPAVPIAGSEWQEFVETFLRFIDDAVESVTLVERRPWEPDLATCDVGWWVRTVDAAFLTEQDRASSILGFIFHWVHYQCVTSREKFNHCSRVCRHWRSNILGECKALGWVVPNATATLREWIVSATYGDTDTDRSYEPHFQPPMSRLRSSVPLPGDIVGVLASQKAYLDEYNAQRELINSIYQALPTDWKYQVRLAKESGRSYDRAIRRQFRQVPPELLLRVEGLYAWLYPSDGTQGEGDGLESEEEDADEVEGSDSQQTEERWSDGSADEEDVYADEDDSADSSMNVGGDYEDDSADSGMDVGEDYDAGDSDSAETAPDEDRAGNEHSKEVEGFGDRGAANVTGMHIQSGAGMGMASGSGMMALGGIGGANTEQGGGALPTDMAGQHWSGGYDTSTTICRGPQGEFDTGRATWAHVGGDRGSSAPCCGTRWHDETPIGQAPSPTHERAPGDFLTAEDELMFALLESYSRFPYTGVPEPDSRTGINSFGSPLQGPIPPVPFDTPRYVDLGFLDPPTGATYRVEASRGSHFDQDGYRPWLG